MIHCQTKVCFAANLHTAKRAVVPAPYAYFNNLRSAWSITSNNGRSWRRTSRSSTNSDKNKSAARQHTHTQQYVGETALESAPPRIREAYLSRSAQRVGRHHPQCSGRGGCGTPLSQPAVPSPPRLQPSRRPAKNTHELAAAPGNRQQQQRRLHTGRHFLFLATWRMSDFTTWVCSIRGITLRTAGPQTSVQDARGCAHSHTATATRRTEFRRCSPGAWRAQARSGWRPPVGGPRGFPYAEHTRDSVSNAHAKPCVGTPNTADGKPCVGTPNTADGRTSVSAASPNTSPV